MPFIKRKKSIAGAGVPSARRHPIRVTARSIRQRAAGKTLSINAAFPRPIAPYGFVNGGIGRQASGARATVKSWARIRKDVRVVKTKLRSLVTSDEMRRWLVAHNSVFGGRSPIEAIYCGDTGRVLETLAQLEEGIFV